jgi:hypothetical protein
MTEMPVYVAVLGFQGVVDDVSVHNTLNSAMKKVDEYIQPSGFSARRWFDSIQVANEYPDEDYEPTNIYECELEE